MIEIMDLTLLLPAFLGGMVVGLFFYGGLWWTVQRVEHARYPALLVLGSFWLRLVGSLGLFLLLANGRLSALLAAAVGFLVLRLFLLGWEWRNGRFVFLSTEE